LFKESDQSLAFEIRDDRHASAPCGATALLHSHEDQSRLPAFELPASPQTGLRTPNPRLIDFYFAPQRLALQVDHSPPEFVQHHPRCFVPTQGKLALQKQRRDAALVSRHQVSCPEPNRQQRFRIMQDRPRRQRNLVTTSGTLPTSELH
jgi:hypothetical protein